MPIKGSTRSLATVIPIVVLIPSVESLGPSASIPPRMSITDGTMAPAKMSRLSVKKAMGASTPKTNSLNKGTMPTIIARREAMVGG